MKFRGLMIAVVVLAALSGVLYWSNHRKPADAAAAASASASPVILKMDRAAISGLTLDKKGAAPITLAKSDGDTWRITEPKPLDADHEAVSGLLSTVSDLNADRVVEDKASDLRPYGLDNPVETVEITGKNHTQRKLLLGDDTPAGGDVYAMIQGDPKVYTIASYNKSSLDKSLNDLRDKRLITIDPDKVNRVLFAHKGQDIEFTRSKDGWQILKPRPARAENSAIDDLVRTISNARMDVGSTGDDHAAADFAKGTPLATVTLTGDQGEQRLDVRKDNSDYYAKSSLVDGVFKVDSSVGSALDKNLDDFRNKKLFDFGYQDPSKIEVHAGAKSWFLTRTGTDWWSNGKKMDPSSVESLIGKLRDLSATGFPDSGFTAPAVEVAVTSDDGKRVTKVEVAKSGDHDIARRDNDPALYRLDASAVSGITSAAEAIRPANK
jgi:hypothetical protein